MANPKQTNKQKQNKQTNNKQSEREEKKLEAAPRAEKRAGCWLGDK